MGTACYVWIGLYRILTLCRQRLRTEVSRNQVPIWTSADVYESKQRDLKETFGSSKMPLRKPQMSHRGISLCLSQRRETHNFVSQHHNSEYRVGSLRFVLVGLFNLRMCHRNSGTVFANEALCTKVCIVCSIFCLYYIRWKTQQKDGNSAAPLLAINL